MAKYDPLRSHLSRSPGRRVSLSFKQVEQIVGSLPASAYRYNAWWSNELNGSHVQAHSWLSAGFRVIGADLATKTVVFARG